MSRHEANGVVESDVLPFKCSCGWGFADEASLAMHVAACARADVERLERDDGADRDKRPDKPCCKRITFQDGGYAFCKLRHGHEVPDGNGAVLSEFCVGDKSYPPPPSELKYPRR